MFALVPDFLLHSSALLCLLHPIDLPCPDLLALAPSTWDNIPPRTDLPTRQPAQWLQGQEQCHRRNRSALESHGLDHQQAAEFHTCPWGLGVHPDSTDFPI